MLEDFNTLTLKRYLYHLAARKLRPRTIRSAFHPLKGLGVYLKELGAVPTNPTASIQLPKLDAARREQVSDAEVRALLAACERQRSPVKVARAVLSYRFCAMVRYGGKNALT